MIHLLYCSVKVIREKKKIKNNFFHVHFSFITEIYSIVLEEINEDQTGSIRTVH